MTTEQQRHEVFETFKRHEHAALWPNGLGFDGPTYYRDGAVIYWQYTLIDNRNWSAASISDGRKTMHAEGFTPDDARANALFKAMTRPADAYDAERVRYNLAHPIDERKESRP